MKENPFPWNLHRDECYNVESLENLYFKSSCNILITPAKKRDKVSNIF